MLDEGLCVALPGTCVVGYVEREAFAASLLLARMADAALVAAPVWCGNLEDFPAGEWRGCVDGITAGFPCQPWSQSGKQQGTDDERWIWPAIVGIIGEVGPDFVFLENVPGLISAGGLALVLGDLAALGFDAEWISIRASDVGAAHQRERVFILGVARREPIQLFEWVDGAESAGAVKRMANPGGGQFPVEGTRSSGRNGTGPASAFLADAAEPRHGNPEDAGTDSSDARRDRGGSSEPERIGGVLADTENDHRRAGIGGNAIFAPGPADPLWRDILRDCPWLAPAVESGVRGVAHGDAVVVDESRADQLRAIGNGVVALQAAVAFRILARRLVTDGR